MANITIRLAQITDVDSLALLLDAYRQFYEQASDLPLAHRFLTERMANQESIIFVAEAQHHKAQDTQDAQYHHTQQHNLVGFCQLYPTFCSVIAAKTATLYDLYVAPEARKSGTGRALLEGAADYAKANDFKRLDLTTAFNNHQAQRLYESLGWQKDTVFWAYTLAIA